MQQGHNQVQVKEEDRLLLAWRALLQEARQRPWLAGLLARRGTQIFNRFVRFYRQLRALPRRLRRAAGSQLRRRLATSLVGAALLFALAGAPAAQAATITVDGTTCSLPDAITAANTDTATNGCDAGSGTDIIDLQANVLLGGALPAISTPLTLEGNGNTIDAGGVGRVLEVGGAQVTINNVTLTGGSADPGAGLYVHSGATVTVNASTISGNTATFNGGGIYGDGGTLTINDSTISGNTAGANGGGLENYHTTTSINRSTFTNNSAPYGGAVDVFWGTVTINNSTISGNTATGDGGGIAVLDAVVLNNSTVTGNGAQNGGGVFSYAGTVTLNRSIISGNTASVGGHELNNNGGTMTGANYNVVGYGGDARSVGFTPGGSDVIPGGALSTVLDSTLAENNGSTFTHALVSGSDAVDIAPNADCQASPVDEVDQRGFPRNVDGNNAVTSSDCDAGAFEYGSGPTSIQLGFMRAQSAADGAAARLSAVALGALTFGYGLWRRATGRASG